MILPSSELLDWWVDIREAGFPRLSFQNSQGVPQTVWFATPAPQLYM